MQLVANARAKVVAPELQATGGYAFDLSRNKVQKGDPGALNGGGFRGNAQVVELASMLLALVDQRYRVGQNYAFLLFNKDASCCC